MRSSTTWHAHVRVAETHAERQEACLLVCYDQWWVSHISGIATPGPTRAQARAKFVCALVKLASSRLKYLLQLAQILKAI